MPDSASLPKLVLLPKPGQQCPGPFLPWTESKHAMRLQELSLRASGEHGIGSGAICMWIHSCVMQFCVIPFCVGDWRFSKKRVTLKHTLM